jgi:hypothetical protein
LTIYENVVGEKKHSRVGAQKGFYRDDKGAVVMGSEPAALKEKRAKEAEEAKKTNAKNAMILPAPLKKGEKIQVLDLSKDDQYFKKLNAWFPKLQTAADYSRSREMKMKMADKSKGHLDVLEVGNYFISLAENLADLERIDPNVFTVSEQIKSLFGQFYPEGYGFVVCSFDPSKAMEAHPIGYIHDVLPDGRLFVPTRHQHTETVEPKEHFDHEIYSVNTKADGDAGLSAAEVEEQNHTLREKHAPTGKPLTLNKGDPENMRKALQTKSLDGFLPDHVTSLRQRKIKGLHDNVDHYFVAA